MDRNQINKELLYKYRVENDKEALEKLIEINTPLVVYVVNKSIYKKNKTVYQFEDYIQYGLIGLNNAINSFDMEKIDEIPFASYARVCIKNSILNMVEKEIKDGKIETIPLDDIGEEVRDDIGREDYELEDKFDAEYKKQKIKQAFNTLNDEAKLMGELYFGLNDNEPKSLAEIAKIFNCSAQKVHITITSIKGHMQHMLDEFKEEYAGKNSEIKHFAREKKVIKKK